MRYTKDQLKSLGYVPVHNNKVMEDYNHNQSRRFAIVKGKFANIIDILFDAKDGYLDNLQTIQSSENTPIEVRMFIQNVMSVDIPSLKSAPDDDAAFESLIPRSVQTSSELAPYISYCKDKFSELRQKYSKQSSDIIDHKITQ